jgi:hypothetical protein
MKVSWLPCWASLQLPQLATLLLGMHVWSCVAFQSVGVPGSAGIHSDCSVLLTNNFAIPHSKRLFSFFRKRPPLYSLHSLVEEATRPDRTTAKIIFVGGKGGGKYDVVMVNRIHPASFFKLATSTQFLRFLS